MQAQATELTAPRLCQLAWLVLLGLLCSSVTYADDNADEPRYALETVGFDAVTPPYLTLTQAWSGLGVDDQDRAYILWTSLRDDGREDAALFRYTRATGQREFLGTFIDTATAQHNLAPGEELPKGHSRIVQVGRKLYMTSQNFHDFKTGLDGLSEYRGAHLFAYDLDSGILDDVSRTLPNGVLIDHQGVIAITYSPEYKLLIGLSHPLSDIVLFDIEQGSVRKIVPGIPWQENHVVSREIVVTRQGKIYTYRGAEEPEGRDIENEVWAYDIATDMMQPTGQALKGGFWNGQTGTRDRSTIYLSTIAGELYVLDAASERFTHLTQFIAPERVRGDYGVRELYGITLSRSEDTIVGVPIIAENGGLARDTGMSSATLYDIAQGTVHEQFVSSVKVFTGSDHRDHEGNIYMSAFDWSTRCRLAILTPVPHSAAAEGVGAVED